MDYQFFLNQINVPAKRSWLFSNIEDDRLMTTLAEQAASVGIYHRDWGILRALRKRLGQPHVTVHETIFPADQAVYDLAWVGIPKGRELARAVLLTALQALKPGGVLYAVGANKGGANTAQTDMRLIAPTRSLGTKARHRLIAVQRPSTITIPAEWGIPWQPEQRVFKVHGIEYPLFTHAGIFSYQHLDEGTAFLLDHLGQLELSPGLRILDAGCGVGIVGMVAQRELSPKTVVWADSDLLAIKCVQMSLPGAVVLPADLTHDLLAGHTPFDLILSNPPFHQGHEQSTAFMNGFAQRARQMLAPDGQLVIVSNRFLPYWDILERHSYLVEFIAENGRYQILAGKPIERESNRR
jgi:16S rRNA (guanine1207-N2)-methyltransferase